ncbi:MAG: hypothetical protein JWL96_2768 [Sphingomonas bacterium]|uniref:lysozyme inhibitor LprI family protein n=1 Tax=Sphingomonas bacterium TaxID=1895847 RepID=UPI0026108A38|nr:lysozyme inhibitor LprI family protein [Sphingomonas bacterium]MDB5710698.1 hypothetical protein [Sphingomonas bacterium]
MAAKSWIMAGIALAIAGVAGASSPEKFNWGRQQDEWSNNPQFADSKAACRRVGDPVMPVVDRPNAAETRALKGCDSEDFYYGDSVKVDDVRARHCAAIEAEHDPAAQETLGGRTILMQLYANGRGVARNLDLATGYACTIDASPAEYEQRITHLERMRDAPDAFDYCDDITSGFGLGLCTYRWSRGGAVERDRELRTLAAAFPKGSAPLYRAMKTAFDAFVTAHDGEVDQSGTNRTMMVIMEQDKVRDQFVLDLHRLKEGKWPALSGDDARAADAQLNASYRKLLAAIVTPDDYPQPHRKDVRDAQRAWLIYRDAYVRFAAIVAPAISGDAILARLTRLRLAQIEHSDAL